MCGGGGSRGPSKSEIRRQEAAAKAQRDAMAEQNRIMMEQMAAQQAAQQKAMADAAAAQAAEQARIAAIPPTQPKQNMGFALAAPANPGTGTNVDFDPLSVQPTLIDNNVKPVVKTNPKGNKGKGKGTNTLTVDKTTAIGSANQKNTGTGLNIPN